MNNQKKNQQLNNHKIQPILMDFNNNHNKHPRKVNRQK